MIDKHLINKFIGLMRDVNLLICFNENTDVKIIEDKIYSESIVEYIFDKYADKYAKLNFYVIGQKMLNEKEENKIINELLYDEFSSYSVSAKEPFTNGLSLLIDVGLSVIYDEFLFK